MSWLGYGIIGVARRQVGSLPIAGNKRARDCLFASAAQHRAFPACHMQRQLRARHAGCLFASWGASVLHAWL